MPVRLRITLLFSASAFLILGIVCVIVYYFSATNRTDYINTRLTNLAITTGRFLSRAETFSPHLIQKIDSLTAIAFTRKTVQAYDAANRKIYSFNDDEADTIHVDHAYLNEVRQYGKIYKLINNKDVVYYNYRDEKVNLIIVAAGYDLFGHDTLKQLSFILLISFIVGVVIAIIVGYIFSTRLLKPLDKIAYDVGEISAQNLTRRIKTGRSKDEWYHLADTLNDLLNRLQESFDLQKRFIANASHELSTPLTAISSQLGVTLQKERNVEEYRAVMTSVYQDIQQLGKLTHTLLEFAKASEAKGGIETRLLRIDEIIMEMPAELSKISNSYSVSLQFDQLPDNEEKLLVYGNQELLSTAIRNIVVNACKYSKDQKAYIFLKADDKAFDISIQNQGSYIPQNEIEKIFQPFYRIETNRTAGGFGLGLSLAKRIIKLHRGEIYVDSQNGTTTFVIQLPSATYMKAG